jgi:hypothetical protein
MTQRDYAVPCGSDDQLPDWAEDISKARSLDDLPGTCRAYGTALERCPERASR